MQTELNDYWTRNRSRCWAVCACAADCLLDHTTETIKSNMAAATVILGLMPCTLSMLGPSVGEMSILSARYPLLAVLLSFASPAIRISDLYHASALPQSSLGIMTSTSMKKWHAWTKELPSLGRTAIRLAECALAGGMLANTAQISLYVDHRTVSGWRCGLMYLPLSWAMAGGLVHLFGAVAIRFRKRASPKSISHPHRPFLISAMRRAWSLFVVQSEDWKCIVNGQDSITVEALFLLASLVGIVHMFFGVMVFSSLMFIGVLDTLPIVARYAISALICQTILRFILASIRLDIQDEEGSGNSGVGH